MTEEKNRNLPEPDDSFVALNSIQQRILEKLEEKATWVTVSELEQEIGVSRRTITRYIMELIELGRVKVTEKGTSTSTNPRYFTLPNYADQQIPLHRKIPLNRTRQKILEKLEEKATWVTVPVLEQEVGVSRRTITHYIIELIELGRVKVTGEGTSTNPHYFTLPNYADQQIPLHPTRQKILEKLEEKATWVTVSVLEQEVGVSRKIIIPHIMELIELGRVKVTGEGTSTNPRCFTLPNYADQQASLHPTRQKILDVLRDFPCTAGQLREKIGKSKAATYRHLWKLMDQGLVVKEKKEDDEYSIYRLPNELDAEHSNVHPHFLILVRMLKLGTWAPAIKGATFHALDELRKEGLVQKETKNGINYFRLTANGVLEAKKMVQK